MSELAFVVKLSKFCNLRCAYCYEHRELHVRDTMHPETLERLFANVDSFAAYLTRFGIAPKFSFVWHGGEPLLLPPEAYLQIAHLQQEHIRNFRYRNSVQTNLYGINKKSLRLVLDWNWELGVSIDFADDVRRNAGGRDSNRSVIAAAEALRQSGARFGAISVLGAHNRHSIPQAYDWVADVADGWRILPMFDGGPADDISRLRLPEDEVVRVFVEVFERRAAAEKHIPIAPLDDYIKAATLRIVGERVAGEIDRDMLDNIFVINVNGDVFTRPFAYDPQFCLGNIARESMTDMVERAAYKTCQSAIRQRKVQNCAACPFRGFCNSSPMHEHGSVTGETGRCAVPQATMAEIERKLIAADIGPSTIAAWAREWLATSPPEVPGHEGGQQT